MRHINGVYTIKVHHLEKNGRHVFHGRFKSILIEASSYPLEISRNIHRNPLELKKLLVEKLVDYPWSSYPEYLNKSTKPDWLITDDVYAEIDVLHIMPTHRTLVLRMKFFLV